MVNNVYVKLTEKIIADLETKNDIYKSLLVQALPIVEEMASLTESPDDAALAAEIKDCLGAE